MIGQAFPPPPLAPDPADAEAVRLGSHRGYCLLCRAVATFRVGSDNLREDVVCAGCGSFTRQRQMLAGVLLALTGGLPEEGVGALPRATRTWNMEASRALHDALRGHLGGAYTASEFLDPALPSGARRGELLHVDMCRTHFADAAFDLVLSSDVLEHVPDHRAGLRETARVTRPGGWYVFTAPFLPGRQRTEVRAVLEPGGGVRHLLPPAYHGDPVRPDEGVLVYQVFGQELLLDLEDAGFDPFLYRLHEPVLGLLGDGWVFAARRRGP